MSRDVRFDETNIVGSKSIVPLPLPIAITIAQPHQQVESSLLFLDTSIMPQVSLTDDLPVNSSYPILDTLVEKSSLAEEPHVEEPLQVPVLRLPSARIRQPSSKLKDAYSYLVEPTTLEYIFPPSPEHIQLNDPIEINYFFGALDEPFEPITFAEANSHLG